MFYVVYNTATKQYRDENGNFGAATEAEQFGHPDQFVTLEANERFVGPMTEAELCGG